MPITVDEKALVREQGSNNVMHMLKQNKEDTYGNKKDANK